MLPSSFLRYVTLPALKLKAYASRSKGHFYTNIRTNSNLTIDKQKISKDLLSSETNSNLSQYCIKNSSPQPQHLQEIYDETFKSVHGAHMMIPPLQGLLLSILTGLRQPKVVLELGCFVGYSALWIAEGLYRNATDSRGHVWTCEIDPKVAKIASQNFKNSGREDLITLLEKPAQQVLESWDLNKKIDIVFIDANKSGYLKYYDTILERELLSENGLIVVDNTCFRGQVHALDSQETTIGDQIVEDNFSTRKKKLTTAQHVHNFNKFVTNDPRTDKLMLPLFDGFTLIYPRR